MNTDAIYVLDYLGIKYTIAGVVIVTDISSYYFVDWVKYHTKYVLDAYYYLLTRDTKSIEWA